MARKPSAVTITPLPETNLDAYQEEANALAAISQQTEVDDLRGAQLIGERIGRRSMGQMIQKLLTVSDLLDLQNIKESNKYKGLVIVGAAGNRQRISTWEEYCELVEERSRQAIDLDLQNLNQLGAELFDSMRQVGIGPGKMRELRKLPEDQQAALLEAAERGDKESLVDLAEELIARHAKEKEELTKKLEDTQHDYDALSKVEADTSKKLREAKLELERAQLRTAPWSEKVSAFQVEIAKRQTLIDEAMGRHLQAVEALDAWLLGEAANHPDYDPEAPLEMPLEVRTVLVELHDAINRSAHQVAAARAALYDRFGHELAQAQQHLLQLDGEPA